MVTIEAVKKDRTLTKNLKVNALMEWLRGGSKGTLRKKDRNSKPAKRSQRKKQVAKNRTRRKLAKATKRSQRR